VLEPSALTVWGGAQCAWVNVGEEYKAGMDDEMMGPVSRLALRVAGGTGDTALLATSQTGGEVAEEQVLRSSRAPILMAIALILAVAALLSTIGGDALWLAALGRVIVARHAIPVGVPFVSAPSAHWPNALVLAELAFNGLERGLGDRGLMLAQLLAVGLAFTVLARDALEDGATADGTAVVLLLVALGALPSLVIVRVQLFSIALFPLLVALLRSEARRPSRRIWFVVPVLALWANLHGAALIGLLVTFAYLLLCRFREDPRTAVAVAIAAAAALFLTPALNDTLNYYHGLLTNVAAQRGVGLWAPLSLGAPFDDLAILVLVALIWRLRLNHPRVWEVAVIVGLAVLSIRASRSAVWLLLFLVGPAARSIRANREWGRLIAPTIVLALATVGLAITRGPASRAADGTLVSRAVLLSRGTPVLASDRLAEEVALDGGRIFLGNPLDAFSHHDQAVYVDWVQGRPTGAAALTPAVGVVLVARGTATDRLMAAMRDFGVAQRNGATVLYVRAR
jgi:hypothetical protein